MTVPASAGIRRAQDAATQGLEALGRRARTFTPPDPMPTESHRAAAERTQRARIEVLDVGRELIAQADELAQAAERARAAGVKALRLIPQPLSWSELGELLGYTAQGAHKRYRHLETEGTRQRTIDDELEPAAP